MEYILRLVFAQQKWIYIYSIKADPASRTELRILEQEYVEGILA
jgi:hypothetical protein